MESTGRKARILRLLRRLELRDARVQKSMGDRWVDAFASFHESTYFHVVSQRDHKPHD